MFNPYVLYIKVHNIEKILTAALIMDDSPYSSDDN